MPRVISANRLADGGVVYAAIDGSWAERFAEAKIFLSQAEAAAGLASAQNDAKRNVVVEPCIVEVIEDAGRLRPATLREVIRAEGPSIDFLPRRRPITNESKPLGEDVAKQNTIAVLCVPRREEAHVHDAEERSRKMA